MNVHWMTITNGDVRYADLQSEHEIKPYTAGCPYTICYISIGPVKMGKSKIVIRRSSSDLPVLNDFIAGAINDQYLFDLFSGWCKDPN